MDRWVDGALFARRRWKDVAEKRAARGEVKEVLGAADLLGGLALSYDPVWPRKESRVAPLSLLRSQWNYDTLFSPAFRIAPEPRGACKLFVGGGG